MSAPRSLKVLAGFALCLGCNTDDLERPDASDDPAGAPGPGQRVPSQGNDGGFGGGAEQGGGHPDSGGGPNVGPITPDEPGLGDQPGQTGGFGLGGAPTQ